MRVIEDHGLDELIAIRVLGWKWVSFIGTPIKGTACYPNKCRVRQLFSPEQMNTTGWQESVFARDGGEVDGSEPLAYAYCSSHAAAIPPRMFILVDE